MEQNQRYMMDEKEHASESLQFSVERSLQCVDERYRGGIALLPDQLLYASILRRLGLIVLNSDLLLRFL